MGTKKPSGLEGFLRFRADSNRCRRFCRPLPSHSATKPVNWDANLAFFNKGAKVWVKKIVISSQYPVVGSQSGGNESEGAFTIYHSPSLLYTLYSIIYTLYSHLFFVLYSFMKA